jgi:hypothetical protein
MLQTYGVVSQDALNAKPGIHGIDEPSTSVEE